MTDAATTLPAQVGAEIAVELSDVHKWYGEFHVLKGINLSVARGERIVMLSLGGAG